MTTKTCIKCDAEFEAGYEHQPPWCSSCWAKTIDTARQLRLFDEQITMLDLLAPTKEARQA